MARDWLADGPLRPISPAGFRYLFDVILESLGLKVFGFVLASSRPFFYFFTMCGNFSLVEISGRWLAEQSLVAGPLYSSRCVMADYAFTATIHEFEAP